MSMPPTNDSLTFCTPKEKEEKIKVSRMALRQDPEERFNWVAIHFRLGEGEEPEIGSPYTSGFINNPLS